MFSFVPGGCLQGLLHHPFALGLGVGWYVVVGVDGVCRTVFDQSETLWFVQNQK